jgi:hypothetical protein
MTKSEIKYQIFLRVAHQNRTFEHCEQSWRTPGVLTVWCGVHQQVMQELVPVYQAVRHQIELKLEEFQHDSIRNKIPDISETGRPQSHI